MNTDTLQTRLASLAATPLRTLVGHRETLPAAATAREQGQSWQRHRREFVGVTDARGGLVEIRSRPPAKGAVSSGGEVVPDALILPGTTALPAVLAQVLGRDEDAFFQDVAVVDDQHHYLGMVPVAAIMRWLAEWREQQASLVEAQRQGLDQDQALLAGTERLQMALAAGRINAWRLDLTTGHVDWDVSAGDHGWSRAMLPGTLEQFQSTVFPEDQAKVVETLETCRAQRKPFSVQYRLRRTDLGRDELRWIESRGMAIGSADQPVTLITGLSVDITERKEAEHALRMAKEEAERANNAKNEFLSRMSHELRTPLNAILGFGQLLEMDITGTGQVQSLSQILRAGRHLLGLIDEVLDISRIESGRLDLEARPLDVRTFADETLGLVSLAAAPNRVHLVNEVANDGCWVVADRQRFRQVLMNLLTNAIKYNRPGGTVTLNCGPAPHRAPGGTPRLRIAVRDTGIGIAPELIGRLFQPFERLGVERESAVGGAGIGLALSKGLIEAMQGSIGVESHLGVGSTFWIELPKAGSAAESHAGDGTTAGGGALLDGKAGQPRPAKARATLLYIEDNASNLRLVESVLSRLRPDLGLRTATDGQSGLAMVHHDRPDLVLLDLQLPGINGEAVLRELGGQAETRATPVIVLSADATPASRERLLAAGARGYLCKPLELKSFLQTVDRVLETIGKG